MSKNRPVESALDLLGRRWALRLVWELRRSTLAFSELRRADWRSAPPFSPRGSASCVDAGVLERDGGRRYRLSGRGRELARVLYELNRWAEQAGVSSRSELA